MATNTILHKIGDTFIAHCYYRDADGDLVNLNTANITITSAVKALNAVFDLDVIIQDQTTNLGMFTIKGQTHSWPLGSLLWDIQYVRDDVIWSSETVKIKTQVDVTP